MVPGYFQGKKLVCSMHIAAAVLCLTLFFFFSFNPSTGWLCVAVTVNPQGLAFTK